MFTEELVLLDTHVCPSGRCAQEILDTVEKSITYYYDIHRTKILGIGVGTCGVVDIKKGIVTSSGAIKDWNNIPLRDYLMQRFNVPIVIENDVKAALYGEAVADKNQKIGSILYLSIGTSIGVAFMQDGHLLRGDHGRLGEIHRYLPRNSRYTLEQLIGGKGISLQYYDETGVQMSCRELALLAAEGNTISERIFRKFTVSTADLLHWLVICFDPSHVILGGGVVCNNSSLFQMIIQQYSVVDNQKGHNLCLAKLGVNSGIYGAAALVKYLSDEEKSFYVACNFKGEIVL